MSDGRRLDGAAPLELIENHISVTMPQRGILSDGMVGDGHVAVRLFRGVFGGGHAVDGFLHESDIFFTAERFCFGLAAHGIEPADLVGVAFDEAGVGGEGWIEFDEGAVHHGKHAGGGFKSFDGADLLAGLDGAACGHGEAGFDQFAQHPGGELGKADAPHLGVFGAGAHPIVGP